MSKVSKLRELTTEPATSNHRRIWGEIQNAFAHAKIPITLDTPEVEAVCDDLVRIKIFDPPKNSIIGGDLP